MPIDQLTHAAYNPRVTLKLGDPEYEKLKKSFKEFGYVDPVVFNVRTGTVIGGHQRLNVMRELGYTEVEVSVVDLPPAKEKALNLALNKIGGHWDMPKLMNLLEELQGEDFDIDLTGFGLKEFDDLVRQQKTIRDVEEDDFDVAGTAAAITAPVTKPGDVWLLGRHRLMCGDSTRTEEVSNLMAGVRAAMCFTDPPWNVAIGKDSNPRHRQREGLVNDNLSAADFAKFLQDFAGSLPDFVEGDVYVVLGASEWPTLDRALREVGYHWSATVIWLKDIFVLGRSKYHRRYEPIWYGWHGKAKSSYCGGRDQDDVWEVPRPKRSEEHPTMKPVILVARALENSCPAGKIVLDLFGGSGTTLLAAEQTGRVCYMMELAPVYCDVIIKRWEAYTGQKAALAAT